MRAFLAATFASVAVRNYRLYVIGQTISVTGSWMQKLALALLVLDTTGSGTWLGVVVAATQLPTLVLGPWAGVLSDRHSKRTILLWVAGLGVVPASALGLAALSGGVSVWVLFALALLAGVNDAMEKPARQCLPNELVGRDLLANAVTLNQVTQNIGKAVGPAIAALLIVLVGIPATFLVNALSYIGVFVGLLMMRPSEMAEPVQRSRRLPADGIRAGIAYVWRTPSLLGPVLLLFAVGLAAYNFQVILPLLAEQTFHGDASQAGYLLSAQGIGAVVGGLALAGIVQTSLRRIVVSALVLGAGFVAVGLSPSFVVALVLVCLLGASSLLFKTMASSWLQLTATREMQGRVMSLLVMAVAGTSPVGAPAIGWLSGRLGTRAVFEFAGIVTVVAAAVTFLYLRHQRALDGATRGEDSSGPPPAPVIAGAVPIET
jgi:MFS family permease